MAPLSSACDPRAARLSMSAICCRSVSLEGSKLGLVMVVSVTSGGSFLLLRFFFNFGSNVRTRVLFPLLGACVEARTGEEGGGEAAASFISMDMDMDMDVEVAVRVVLLMVAVDMDGLERSTAADLLGRRSLLRPAGEDGGGESGMSSSLVNKSDIFVAKWIAIRKAEQRGASAWISVLFFIDAHSWPLVGFKFLFTIRFAHFEIGGKRKMPAGARRASRLPPFPPLRVRWQPSGSSHAHPLVHCCHPTPLMTKPTVSACESAHCERGVISRRLIRHFRNQLYRKLLILVCVTHWTHTM